MDIDRVKQLIEQCRETEIIDFKEQFHDNKAELLHDILCLANNTQFQDAYLVFGINDRGETIGVESQPNRIKLADMQGLLHDNRLKFFDNALPEVDVAILSDSGHEIDVLEIKSTLKVPYFLIEEYRKGGVIVRSGHIYTRTGDRNTPINQCATTAKTIRLWEKRFGRLEKHLNTLLMYLDDLPNWEIEQLWNNNLKRYYYGPDPSFTIESEFDFESDYALPKYQAQPYGISTIYRGTYRCFFKQIVIKSGEIFYIDGTKSIISETEYYHFQPTSSGNLVLSMDYYLENSVNYKLLHLFRQEINGYSEYGLNLFFDQTLVFDSQDEADEFIHYVKMNIQEILTKVEERSGIQFEDAPYDPRLHDEFRIHTGVVLKKIQCDLKLNELNLS
jgi:hypothetical protein